MCAIGEEFGAVRYHRIAIDGMKRGIIPQELQQPSIHLQSCHAGLGNLVAKGVPKRQKYKDLRGGIELTDAGEKCAAVFLKFLSGAFVPIVGAVGDRDVIGIKPSCDA